MNNSLYFLLFRSHLALLAQPSVAGKPVAVHVHYPGTDGDRVRVHVHAQAAHIHYPGTEDGKVRVC